MSVRNTKRTFCRRITALIMMLIMMLSFAPSACAAKAYLKTAARAYKRPTASSVSVKGRKGTKVKVVASKKGWSKIKYKGKTGYVKTKNLTAKKTVKKSSKKTLKKAAKNKIWKSKVKAVSWSEGKNSLKKGSYGRIYDTKTGIEFKAKRMGGHNHMDMEPATKTDTAKLFKISGGKWSWKTHSVILKAGKKYIAASINTKPHGDQTITNNGYNGQFCLHLTGSKTHGSNTVNENQQKSVYEAYEWAH